MRGLYFRQLRVKRVLAVGLWIALFCVVFSQHRLWMKELAEDKLEGLLGGRYDVTIRDVRGGIFGDMVLEDVVLRNAGTGGPRSFDINKVEIAYRLWWPIAEKLGLREKSKMPAEFLAVYFSEKNPFVRGVLRIGSRPGEIEFFGDIRPIFLGMDKKLRIQGYLKELLGGTYQCGFSWDGVAGAKGIVDPEKRSMELEVLPSAASSGCLKVKASMNGKNKTDIYCRADKLIAYDKEIIGDAWLSCCPGATSDFSLKVENVIVDKRPYWDLSVEGSYVKSTKSFIFSNVKIGSSISASGSLCTVSPYESNLKLIVKNLDLALFGQMVGGKKLAMKGLVQMEIALEGPVMTPLVKGRITSGAGFIGNLEFKSIYGELVGKYPTIKVVDGRIVQDGGGMTVSGDADLSRPGGNKFANMEFGTENAVTFMSRWQITRAASALAGNESGVLGAQGNEGLKGEAVPNPDLKDDANDVGVKFRFDSNNSVKLERKEDQDLIGVEHKMQF
jgi:hypothetical protein